MPDAKMTPHEERQVAVAAGCDPRTVRAYLAGRPQTSTTAARVREALAVLAPRAARSTRGGDTAAAVAPEAA